VSRAGRARRWSIAAVAVVTACSADADGGSGDGARDDDGGGADDGVVIEDAWARSTPPGATTGAVYFTISSRGDDVIEGAAVSPGVAGEAQLHMTMTGSDGTSMMHAVRSLEVPAGEAVSLEPNGVHVMLVDLAAPLAAGDAFDLTVDLARAADVTVSVDVADDPP
jgi:periplasmic copper chaperone A